VRGEKTIENRSRKLFAPERWELPFWCLVAASAQWMRGAHSGFTVQHSKRGKAEGLTRAAEGHARLDPPEGYPTGAIVGAMRISGMVPVCDVTAPCDLPWASGAWCLQISAAVALPSPVPHKGQLGLHGVSPALLGAANLACLAAAVGAPSADGAEVACHFQRVLRPGLKRPAVPRPLGAGAGGKRQRVAAGRGCGSPARADRPGVDDKQGDIKRELHEAEEEEEERMAAAPPGTTAGPWAPPGAR
jgi:hypothetical protein